MIGLLGSIIRKGDADEDGDVMLRPSREFTKNDILRLSEQAAEQWRDEFSNLLSCFDLSSKFGLWQTLQAYYTSRSFPADVIEALQNGDAGAYLKSIFKAQCAAFIDLYECRNSLGRICLVDVLPGPAAVEFIKMKQHADVALAASAAVPAAAQAPVAPPAPVDPVDQCAKDWKEMGSTQFKKKYISDTRLRPYFDAAQERGLI